MAQPKKGQGMTTRTFTIDGNTYQERRITCGKQNCKTCKEELGHLAYYMDGGLVDGKRKWIYTPHLPKADPNYQPPTCQREGCNNPTPRRNAKYCSSRCKMADRRAKGIA